MENQTNKSEEGNATLYTWRALEFNGEVQRPRSWYLTVGGIWLLFVIYTLWAQEWMRFALLLLLAVVVWLVLKMKPREFQHALTEGGIMVGNKRYAYTSYKAFGVVRGAEGYKISVIPSNRFSPGLTLQVGGGDVERIRAILTQYLSEEPMSEDIVDKTNRWLRF